MFGNFKLGNPGDICPLYMTPYTCNRAGGDARDSKGKKIVTQGRPFTGCQGNVEMWQEEAQSTNNLN
jgi:hypothetical protein